MSVIRLKRAYDPAEPEDGTRILVDRLWPRGLSRDAAKVDHWLKEVAPSAELRRWFGHDPAKWAEFHRRYDAELAHNPALEELRALSGLIPISEVPPDPAKTQTAFCGLRLMDPDETCRRVSQVKRRYGGPPAAGSSPATSSRSAFTSSPPPPSGAAPLARCSATS